MGRVWQGPQDTAPNPRIVDQMQRKLRGAFPPLDPADVAVVEAAGTIVASAALWHERWSYGGEAFAVGRPEWVGTDPAYRNWGCVRELMRLLHARSAARGDLLLAITGISYFYRQFGYEYVLELNAKRTVAVDDVPAADGAAERCTLRPAAPADLPAIGRLYASRRPESLVWNEVDPAVWKARVRDAEAVAHEGRSAAEHGVSEQLLMIEDEQGAVCGFVMLALKRWDDDLQVHALELAPGADLAALAPSLLRALLRHGQTIPAVRPDTEPLRRISLLLGSRHPLYTALPQAAAPLDPPYAWYLRVPDLAAFVRRIAPALERALAKSAAAGYTGELRIDCYTEGLRLVLEHGRLSEVAPWRALPTGPAADARCPALPLLKLVFGYRSLGELQGMFPDVWISAAARPLVEALFAPRYSWVLPL
jgi:hypothetical protein